MMCQYVNAIFIKTKLIESILHVVGPLADKPAPIAVSVGPSVINKEHE